MKTSFVSSSLFIFSATLVSSIANYILQIIFARFFSVEDYGMYNAVNSLSFFFVFIATPLQNFTIKNVITIKNDNEKLSQFFHFYTTKFFLYISLLSIPFSIIMYIVGEITAIPVIYVLAIMGVCVIGNFYTVYSAMLRGLQAFITLAIITLVFTSIRFFTLVLLLQRGATLKPVMGVTFIFALINLILFYFALPSSMRKYKKGKDISTFYSLYRTFISYLLKTGLIYFLFSALMQSDTLLIKYFFSDYETGIYSSASIFGKAVMYLPGAVVMVLFPLVSENTNNGKSSLPVLLKALSMNILLSGGGALGLYLFPNLVTIFFSTSYTEAIPVMRYLGFAFLPLSMINILFTFYLAKDRFDCIIPLSVAFIAQLLLFYFFHESLQQAVGMFFISGVLGLVSFIGIEVWSRRKIR